MTTDENIMEEMLDRATNACRDTVDELGVQMFCMVVRSNLTLVHKAQDSIVAKIRSNNITEATRAIALLEECMTKCGTVFQDEVSKFRFLNEFIRLVSEKYHGAVTPTPIKQRIMECLLLWTTEFPQKLKIREAYDMLNKEGGIEHGNSAAVVAKRESTLGIDEQVLSKLIHSRDPEDYKRANLLIQYRVSQEARRTELILQQKSELQEVQNTVSLLNQMLDVFECEDCKNCDDNESVSLMRELYMACKKHKPILQRLHEMVENTDEQLLEYTLETNDLLHAVMKRYKSIIVHPSSKLKQTTPTNSGRKQLNSAKVVSNAELLSQLLGDVVMQPTTAVDTVDNGGSSAASTSTAAGEHSAFNARVFDELSGLFGGVAETETTSEVPKYPTELLESLDLLEPVNVFPSAEAQAANNDGNAPGKRERAFRELREIDQLSEELFKKSLQTKERVGSFKKDGDKLTLNDLAKEKYNFKATSTPPSTPTKSALNGESKEQSSESLASLRIEDEKMLTVSGESQKDELMLSTEIETVANKDPEGESSVNESTNKVSEELPLKHLSEISVNLDDVTATEEEHVLMDDDDMKITLNFTKDRPSRHVSVIVISVLNKSKMPVKDFNFEASVKKPCKVRLLPPTASSMPAYKPFRPPAPINQVMLLLNPTGSAVDVICIVGYKLGDDPDPINESIVAKDIPFVE